MRNYQSVQSGPIPFRTKISLGLGAVMILALLFFFAFTFFLITLISGLALFIFNLFQRAKNNLGSGRATTRGRTQPFRRSPENNDDVIDV